MPISRWYEKERKKDGGSERTRMGKKTFLVLSAYRAVYGAGATLRPYAA